MGVHGLALQSVRIIVYSSFCRGGKKQGSRSLRIESSCAYVIPIGEREPKREGEENGGVGCCCIMQR